MACQVFALCVLHGGFWRPASDNLRQVLIFFAERMAFRPTSAEYCFARIFKEFGFRF